MFAVGRKNVPDEYLDQLVMLAVCRRCVPYLTSTKLIMLAVCRRSVPGEYLDQLVGERIS